jgi:carbonic anhydrase/acetyltransferase-like protein (isoleucine patch superfamily)
MGAVLLQKVVCEEGVIVAAGAVVPQGMHIPPRKLVAGNPAKIIKDITPEMEAYVAMGVDAYKELNRLYRQTMTEIAREET